MIITVNRVGESKDLMIEYGSLRFRVSMGLLFWHNALSPAGKRDTRTHVSLGSNFLFYLICYYASVSYFLKEMFLTYNAKCFPQGNVFLLRIMKAILHAHEREMLACYFLFFLS